MQQTITIPTQNPNVQLRQWSCPADDVAVFRAIDANREHISQFGENLSDMYQTVADVRRARLDAELCDQMDLAIWNRSFVVGAVALTNFEETDIGTWLAAWLDKRHVGLGYATLACQVLIPCIRQWSDFSDTVTTSVNVANYKSQALLGRLGFKRMNYTPGDSFYKRACVTNDHIVYQLDYPQPR